MSVALFFNMATDKLLNPKHPKLLCSRSTFFHWYKMYQTTHILPSVDDEGMSVGRSQYIVDQNLNNLNKDVNETIGLDEKNGTIASNIGVVIETRIQYGLATNMRVFVKAYV